MSQCWPWVPYVENQRYAVAPAGLEELDGDMRVLELGFDGGRDERSRGRGELGDHWWLGL